jgi:hypothetical protein
LDRFESGGTNGVEYMNKKSRTLEEIADATVAELRLSPKYNRAGILAALHEAVSARDECGEWVAAGVQAVREAVAADRMALREIITNLKCAEQSGLSATASGAACAAYNAVLAALDARERRESE